MLLQDATIKHQGSRSGVSRDNLRTVVQKKLSIVGKALESNSRSKRLLRLKLRLMSELLPADQFSSEIEDLLSKDQENMIMWQFFITNSQKSVALCHVPKILNLYARFFTFISKRNRSNPQLYDKRILGDSCSFNFMKIALALKYSCLSFFICRDAASMSHVFKTRWTLGANVGNNRNKSCSQS